MSEQPMSTGVNFNHPAHGTVKILDPDAGVVESFTPDGRKRKKVAIVGFAPSKELTPFEDPEYEIWGVNQLYRHIPRATRWFDIHKNWNEHVVEGTDHGAWLRNAPIPTYMVERILEGNPAYLPGIPNSVRFPIERVTEGAGNPKYLTSTIAFMIALALEEGFTTIALYGIDLIVGTEWFYQKACAEFWLGTCHGRGVEVIVPQESALCKSAWIYGYEIEPPMWPIKISDIESRVSHLKNERHKKMIELSNIDGALQEAEMWFQIMDVKVKGGQRPQ